MGWEGSACLTKTRCLLRFSLPNSEGSMKIEKRKEEKRSPLSSPPGLQAGNSGLCFVTLTLHSSHSDRNSEIGFWGQMVRLPRATHSQRRAQTQHSPASKKTAQTPALLKTVRRGLWSHCKHKCLGFQPRAPGVFKGSPLMQKTSGLSEGIASVSANEAFRTAKDEEPNFEWV